MNMDPLKLVQPERVAWALDSTSSLCTRRHRIDFEHCQTIKGDQQSLFVSERALGTLLKDTRQWLQSAAKDLFLQILSQFPRKY